MKKAALLTALLIAGAGYVFLQTNVPRPNLAGFMPGGALLYLETPDFTHLLQDWDSSTVKTGWLASDNYAAFSRSNLFSKLQDVYTQYGEAVGFAPDLASVIGMAGTDSALALYDIHDVQFLYITRIPDAGIAKSPLWALRDKFQQRQAGGVSFYLRSEPASKRTVAFAAAQGYLFVATRDDLVAQALQLLAGASLPSIAADRWYRESTAAASNPGDLRLVMNLELLVKNDYFRSYWIQRNASEVRGYWAGVADVTRASGAITENRVFLRSADAGPSAQPAASVANLAALAPPDAGFYRATPVADASAATDLIVEKLIAPQAQAGRDERIAPWAASPDVRAGTEADLETRIDEQPLPADTGLSDATAAIRGLIEKAGALAELLVESSAPAAGPFVEVHSAIVLDAAQDWDIDAVKRAFSGAAGKLWTSSQLGADWGSTTVGSRTVERLNGLGSLMLAANGRRLFLANDAALLAAVLDRGTAPVSAGAATYAAAFRHARERADFVRRMSALDFTAPAENSAFRPLRPFGQPKGAAPFFSGNIASLSGALSNVSEILVTARDQGALTFETVVYRLER